MRIRTGTAIVIGALVVADRLVSGALSRRLDRWRTDALNAQADADLALLMAQAELEQAEDDLAIEQTRSVMLDERIAASYVEYRGVIADTIKMFGIKHTRLAAGKAILNVADDHPEWDQEFRSEFIERTLKSLDNLIAQVAGTEQGS